MAATDWDSGCRKTLGRHFDRADGKVDEPEILRSEGGTDWTDVVLKSIKTRIYAPLKAETGKYRAGHICTERYSLTAQYENDVTGTRIRQFHRKNRAH
jgi:hypothetical protein